MFRNWILGPAVRLFLWALSFWPTIKRVLAFLFIAPFFFVVAYAVWINLVDPTGFGLLDENSRRFWTKVGPISALIFIGLKALWGMATSDGSLKHIVVSTYDKTDMKQMAHYMKDADLVFIYSGDFSYVYDHEPLYRALEELAGRGNLRFISYKDEITVLAQSGARRGTHDCLVQALIDGGKVSFDVPGRAKFSLVYKRGEEVFLYRHREASTDYVTVFKANNAQTKQLVETVRTLVDVMLISHPPKSAVI